MSKRSVVVIALLVVSLVLGLAIGEAGFRLYRVTMPPAAISSFNLGNAHLWYVVSGLGAGLVIFVWSLIAALLGRVGFAPSAKPASPIPPAAAGSGAAPRGTP
jgi:uncharacterized membrane protein YtjA (UPF0391 family)